MSKKNKTRKKHYTGSFILGLIVLLFAAFGVYKAVSMGVNKVQELRTGSSRFTEYETFLEPFVVIDPSPFDDISGANPTDLLDAAISAMIYDSDKMSTYDVFEGEVTGLLVPQGDVQAYFIRLFGNEVQMNHQAVANSFYNVIYNPEKHAYILPITSVDPLYTPKVYDMEKTGSSITLTVGYIIGSEWAQLEHGNYTAPDPAKYMKITLREASDGYHIGSLRNSEAVEIADPVKAAPTSPTAVTKAATTTAAPTTAQSSNESTTGNTADKSNETTGTTASP